MRIPSVVMSAVSITMAASAMFTSDPRLATQAHAYASFLRKNQSRRMLQHGSSPLPEVLEGVEGEG